MIKNLIKKWKQGKFLRALKKLTKNKEITWEIYTETTSENYNRQYCGLISGEYIYKGPDFTLYIRRSNRRYEKPRETLFLNKDNKIIITISNVNVHFLYNIVNTIVHEKENIQRDNTKQCFQKKEDETVNEIQDYIIELCWPPYQSYHAVTTKPSPPKSWFDRME